MLTGELILHHVETTKQIQIRPFDKTQIKANSYDVRLGRNLLRVTDTLLDVKKAYNCELVRIPEEGMIIGPGEFYLGVTQEWTCTPNHVPTLEGRSTMARYNLVIHQTAGFGDLGFAGHWTLELTATKPVRIYAGMRVGQLSFFTPAGDPGEFDRYQGGYSDEYSDNPYPVPARPGNI